MARASDVLSVAEKEIGYVEESGNRTKYGKAYGMDGVYWCMIFVWWCFAQAGASALFCGGGKCASCSQLMQWAKQHGKWVTKDYKAGDVLIYDFPGNSVRTDHTGLCVEYNDKYVTAIEGNTSATGAGSQNNGDVVARKRREAKLVLGAYRPDYEPEYAEVLQKRAGLAASTMQYLAGYKYGADLIRKLATME